MPPTTTSGNPPDLKILSAGAALPFCAMWASPTGSAALRIDGGQIGKEIPRHFEDEPADGLQTMLSNRRTGRWRSTGISGCHSDTAPAKSGHGWFSVHDFLQTAAGKNGAIETSALDVP